MMFISFFSSHSTLSISVPPLPLHLEGEIQAWVALREGAAADDVHVRAHVQRQRLGRDALCGWKKVRSVSLNACRSEPASPIDHARNKTTPTPLASIVTCG